MFERCGWASALVGLPLLLAACAALHGSRADVWPLPDPALAPFSRKLQDIEIRRDGRSAHFLAVLERQKNAVLMVGLSPLGQRLVWVRWSLQGLSTEVAPQAAPYFDARQVLDELSFALWPRRSLEAAFKAGPFRAAFSPGRRTLWKGAQVVLIVERNPDGTALVLTQPGRDGRISVHDVAGGER